MKPKHPTDPKPNADGSHPRDARLYSDQALAVALLIDGLPHHEREQIHDLAVKLAGKAPPEITAPTWGHVDGRISVARRLEAQLRHLPEREADAAKAEAEARKTIARLSAMPTIDYETANRAQMVFTHLHFASWYLVCAQDEITRLGGWLADRKMRANVIPFRPRAPQPDPEGPRPAV